MLLFPSLNCFPTWVITSQLINSSSRRCLRWSGLTKATAKSPTFSIIHANGCSMFWPIIHQNRVLLSLWEIVDRGVKQHGKRTSLSFRKHVRKHTLLLKHIYRYRSLGGRPILTMGIFGRSMICEPLCQSSQGGEFKWPNTVFGKFVSEKSKNGGSQVAYCQKMYRIDFSF